MWWSKKNPQAGKVPTVPYCQDCKHYKKGFRAFYDNCTHPEANPINPVRRDQGGWAFCQHQRRWAGHCQYEGRWFEPK